jgi:hypothetical protein
MNAIQASIMQMKTNTGDGTNEPLYQGVDALAPSVLATRLVLLSTTTRMLFQVINILYTKEIA